MAEVTSEYMDYENVKKVMGELKLLFDAYSDKLGEVNSRMLTDVNAGSESAIDTTVLGQNIVDCWEDLSSDFQKFEATFTMIHDGVAQASSSDEAFENLALVLANYGDSEGGTSNSVANTKTSEQLTIN